MIFDFFEKWWRNNLCMTLFYKQFKINSRKKIQVVTFPVFFIFCQITNDHTQRQLQLRKSHCGKFSFFVKKNWIFKLNSKIKYLNFCASNQDFFFQKKKKKKIGQKIEFCRSVEIVVLRLEFLDSFFPHFEKSAD